MTDTKMHYCDYCDEDATKKCSACKGVWYCSVNCQKEDWPDHLAWCKSYKQAHIEGKITVIKADGTQTDIQIRPIDLTVEKIQSIVGGYFQRLFLDNDQIMLVNEEAKLHHLAINRRASDLAFSRYQTLIAGDVIAQVS